MDDVNDPTSTDKSILLGFHKKQADERKLWLMNYNKNDIITNDVKEITISEFVNKELKHFSFYDIERSIGSVCDGFKPSQRKILYGALKRKLFTSTSEIKVAQLAGYISDIAAYHHGEASLMGAIIAMAQNFVGSNNINLLYPSGNFGDRLLGGKNAASPRYIFTRLADVTPLIFLKDDEGIYNYVDDDGLSVEPEVYAPIIPMILVNGCVGIGTGFSTNIPCFNPLDIIENIKNILENKPYKNMIPWYKGFKGPITKIDNNNYKSRGIIELVNENEAVIEELPVGVWTDIYKETLDELVADDPKFPEEGKFLSGYKDSSGTDYVKITVYFIKNKLKELIKQDEQYKKLKLEKSISLNNMHLHDINGNIKKYDTVQDILNDYVTFRMSMYDKRKAHQSEVLKNELEILNWKIKFIEYYQNKKIIIYNRTKDDVINDLVNLGFPKVASTPGGEKKYGYLTKLPIFSLTKEKLEELKKERDIKQEEYETYINTPIKTIWLRELSTLEVAYKKSLGEKPKPVRKINNKKK